MTARQFYLTIFLFAVLSRIQKMPSFVAGILGKDSYLIILLYFLIDFVGIVLAFFILKVMKNEHADGKISTIKKIINKCLLFLTSLYFLFQSILMFEAIEDLFAHILFYNLSWKIFGFFLLASVFFLAFSGLKGIGRMMEMFFPLILVSLVILSIFGGIKTDFSSILPFSTINFSNLFRGAIKFNLWFGDFFLVLFLGKHSNGIKLKWTSLIYFSAMAIVCLFFVEFYGIYGIFAPIQPSLISTISELSMWGVNIGRIDWFLILFTEIGTILCSGLCLYFSQECLSEVFVKIKPIYLDLILSLILFFLDIFVLVDMNIKEFVFLNIAGYFSTILKLFIFLITLSIYIVKNQKNKKLLKLRRNYNG